MSLMPQSSPRVWVVTECYPRPTMPGACSFVHRQMVGLKQAGWDVSVSIPNGWFPPVLWRAAPAWRQAQAQAIPPRWCIDGIPVNDLCYQNRVPSRLCRPLDAGARVTEALDGVLAKACANPQQDIVLCQFALPYGPAVRDACRRHNLKYAIHLRGDDVTIWPHQRADRMEGFRRAVFDADLVLAVSQAILDEARALTRQPLPRTCVIPNGIDLEMFRPATLETRTAARESLDIPARARVILCVGSIIARKGWRELLQSLSALKDSNLILLAAADTRVSEYDLTVEHLKLAPEIPLIVQYDLSAQRLAALYQAADIFCLPSYGEGISNALLEAMAAGLPVITTRVGGHPEVVTNGVEGLLVPPREITPLAEALKTLLGEPQRLNRMGEAARRRAESIGNSTTAGAHLAQALAETLTATPTHAPQRVNYYTVSLESAT
ncbi:MAG: glycosyltransferase [Pyrinomonadaceae bacterium]